MKKLLIAFIFISCGLSKYDIPTKISVSDTTNAKSTLVKHLKLVGSYKSKIQINKKWHNSIDCIFNQNMNYVLVTYKQSSKEYVIIDKKIIFDNQPSKSVYKSLPSYTGLIDGKKHVAVLINGKYKFINKTKF